MKGGLQMPESSTTPEKPIAVTEAERLGFTWKLEPQYDLTQLSTNGALEDPAKVRRVQVRELSHYAPKDTVERFAIQMTVTPFPPVVVTRDGWLVDGNTRVGAKVWQKELAEKRGSSADMFYPAVILDVNYEGVARKQQNLLHALAATLNCNGGKQLEAKEIREVSVRLIELGWKTEQIARAIGLKASSVTQVKREIEAADRMRRVGLRPNGESKGPSLRALGGKEVQTLTDVPFRELAQLSIDAGLNASEITSGARQALETGSEAGQLEVIETLRGEMQNRIKDKAFTGKGVPPVSRQLRQHLGFVVKFVGREQELVETAPTAIETHVERLESGIAVLTETLRLQQEG
jgi:hypothetical protein